MTEMTPPRGAQGGPYRSEGGPVTEKLALAGFTGAGLSPSAGAACGPVSLWLSEFRKVGVEFRSLDTPTPPSASSSVMRPEPWEGDVGVSLMKTDHWSTVPQLQSAFLRSLAGFALTDWAAMTLTCKHGCLEGIFMGRAQISIRTVA